MPRGSPETLDDARGWRSAGHPQRGKHARREPRVHAQRMSRRRIHRRDEPAAQLAAQAPENRRNAHDRTSRLLLNEMGLEPPCGRNGH
jgi:hypothetical protein